MTGIILEDEVFARNRLARLIEEVRPELKIIGQFSSVEETAKFLMNLDKQPDIAFLDIQVEDGNSFELFQLVNIKSKIIFTTAYDEYAVEAFRKNAIDYLLKPLRKYELADAINKAKILNDNRFEFIDQEHYKNRFLIKFGSKLKSVKTDDIAYIHSKNKLSYFYTFEGDKIASEYKLQELESMLDPKIFFRANRQIIVNLDAIKEMSRIEASRIKINLVPSFDNEVVVSTERTKLFKSWLEQ